jgi:thioredoxin reductase (NADPH)
VDIEKDKAGKEFVVRTNKVKRIISSIIFSDGSFLVEPSNAELVAKLKHKTTASRSYYDLIVLGGGPAGAFNACGIFKDERALRRSSHER